MEKYAMIATWKMSFDGVKSAIPFLEGNHTVSACIRKAINVVENNPEFRSVGYGGLPNRDGFVELDAGYMDGNTMHFGGVIETRSIRNPIDVAIKLSENQLNCLLSGDGAERFAIQNGFEMANLLTEEATRQWAERVEKEKSASRLEAYNDHDTVNVICKKGNSLAVGVSTSGLFMKNQGRVGDSPVIGSGFYCDSTIGSASATGVGEDVMRGCLSYEIVRQIKEGKHPLAACESALTAHLERLNTAGVTSGSISLIAMDKDGNFGAATTHPQFIFVTANQEKKDAQYWVARKVGENHGIHPATEENLKDQ